MNDGSFPAPGSLGGTGKVYTNARIPATGSAAVDREDAASYAAGGQSVAGWNTQMTALSRLKLAVVQLAPGLLELERNVERHLDLIADARARGADVVVFPELSLTGYGAGAQADAIAMSLEGRELDPNIEKLAVAAGGMTVLVGFVEEGYGAQFFNSVAALRSGSLVHVHRKLNLANYGAMEEAKYFAQGRYLSTFELPGPFTAATLVCSDMWNPALVYLAALHGATLLIAPTNSSLDLDSGDFEKPHRWDLALEFYASLYGMPIAFANRVGTEARHQFWGGSRILDARGRTVAKAGPDEETTLLADIDYQDVRAARFQLPTVRDSNLALIHREIDRLARKVGVPRVVRDE